MRKPDVVVILFAALATGISITEAADYPTTDSSPPPKARVVEAGYAVRIVAGQTSERLTYRVDIGDTALPSALARRRHPVMGDHVFNARVLARTTDGRWLHKNLAELTPRGIETTAEEFREYMRQLEDEREVEVSELPNRIGDLPAELLNQISSIWYHYANIG